MHSEKKARNDAGIEEERDSTPIIVPGIHPNDKPPADAISVRAEVAQFLILLGHNFSKPGAFELRRIRANGREKECRSDWFDALDWVRIDALNKTWNLYFGVIPRRDRVGDKMHVTEARCVWTDLDAKDFDPGDHENGKKLALAAIEARCPSHLRPTAIVDSGHGYHLYWALAEAVEFPDAASVVAFEDVLHGIAVHFDGDVSCAEIARVMRMPSTLNRRDEDRLCPCTIKLFKPERVYQLDDLAEFFPPMRKGSAPKSATTFATGTPDAGTDKIMEGRRNATLASLGGTMRKRGMTENEIAIALLAINSARCVPPLDEAEVRGIAASVAKYDPAPASPIVAPAWPVFTVGTYVSPTDRNNFGKIVAVLGGDYYNVFFHGARGDNEKRFHARELRLLGGGTGTATTARPFRLLTFADVMQTPEPTWLLDDIIEGEALHLVYGARSSYKSFLLIGWLMAIARGENWFGFKVAAPRPVILVAAEGARGLGKRFRAFHCDRQGQVEDVPLIRVLARPLIVANPEHLSAFRDVVCREIDTLGQSPAVVALDTTARCLLGLEENSNKDMGTFLDAVDGVCRDFCAAGILVHHSGWDGKHERGASGLGCGVDHVIRVERLAGPGFKCEVESEKAKDSADDGKLSVGLRLCQYGAGEKENSLVVSSALTFKCSEGLQVPNELKTLGVYLQHNIHGQLSYTQWKQAVFDVLKVQEATFLRHVNCLLERKFVNKGPGKRDPYVITEAGKEALRKP